MTAGSIRIQNETSSGKENLQNTATSAGISHKRGHEMAIDWSSENSMEFPKHMPLKSILKNGTTPINRSKPHNSLPIPTIQMSHIEAEPLRNPHFLRGPLSTLVSSLRLDDSNLILQHDICEAYSVLSSRIRSQAHKLTTDATSYAALDYMRELRVPLLVALQRDIKCAFANPLLPPNPVLIPSASTAVSPTKGPFLYQTQYARDMVAVSHSSLCFLSNVFRLSSLQNIFSHDELSVLLDKAIDIALSPSLPTPNARKTYTLALWLLTSQRLPATIILKAKGRLVNVLNCSIRGNIYKDGKKGPIYDGLRVMAEQLRCHPAILLQPCFEFTAYILQHLTSTKGDLRMQAALALGGLTYALSSGLPTTEELRNTTSRSVRQFVDSQKRKSPQPHPLLGQILSASLADQNMSHTLENPIWALSVIASLVVLSGPRIFSHPVSLKLVTRPLEEAKKNKRPSVRRIQPAIWNCFVWAYSQLTSDNVSKDDIAEQCFDFVKQELSGDTGVVLVGALLNVPPTHPASKERVSKSMIVIDDMIKVGGSVRELGIRLLRRLLGGVGEYVISCNWRNSNILLMNVVDGTLIKMREDKRTKAVEALEQMRVEDLRVLNEEELSKHWDLLFNIWASCVVTHEAMSPSPTLVDIWQCLLLVQAQLTQGHKHLTMQTEHTARISLFLTSLFVPESSTHRTRSLFLVRRLWSTVRNVFSSTWLESMAKSLLGPILGHAVDFEDTALKEAWSLLCADVIAVASPGCLEILFQMAPEEQEVELRRQLWTVACTQCTTETNADWHGLVSLLIIPIGCWKLSEDDIVLWESQLRAAVAVGGCVNEVLDSVCSKIRTSKSVQSPLTMLRLIIILLSFLPSADHSLVLENLLSFTAESLAFAYLPSDNIHLDACLNIFASLRCLFDKPSSSLNTLITNLTILQVGLIPWIEDKDSVVPDDRYNECIISLFCASIECLKIFHLTVDIMLSLADYLVSVFTREGIPFPASGPLAFKALWECTLCRLDLSEKECPLRVKVCVKSLVEAYGGELPDWMESESLSATSQDNTRDVDHSTPSSSKPFASGPSRSHVSETPVARTNADEQHGTPRFGSLSHRFAALASDDTVPSSVPGESPRYGALFLEHAQNMLFSDRGSPKARTRSLPLDIVKETSSATPSPRKKRKLSRSSQGATTSTTSQNLNSCHEENVLTPTPSQPFRSGVTIGTLHNSSRPRRRLFLDAVEVPTWKQIRKRESELHSDPSSEDYESWETGISEQDVLRSEELASSPEVEAYCALVDRSSQPDVVDTQLSDMSLSSAIETQRMNAVSLSINVVQPEQHLPARSQTAPVAYSSGSGTNIRPAPLLRRVKTTSATPLDALQRLRSVLSIDVAGMRTQELTASGKLLNEMAGIVTDAMASKLKNRSK